MKAGKKSEKRSKKSPPESESIFGTTTAGITEKRPTKTGTHVSDSPCDVYKAVFSYEPPILDAWMKKRVSNPAMTFEIEFESWEDFAKRYYHNVMVAPFETNVEFAWDEIEHFRLFHFDSWKKEADSKQGFKGMALCALPWEDSSFWCKFTLKKVK